MENQTRNSLIPVLIIIIIAALFAWAGSQGGFTIAGIPIFAICIALAFVINWIVFIPSFFKQTEQFFDLTGGITYLSVTWVAILLSPLVDQRSWLLAALISVWAVRLALFLFRRVRSAGEDRRFRELKTSFARFLMVWTLQGLWVSLTVAAALAAVTTKSRLDLGIYALVGFIVWLVGFGIEVVADRQKSAFRAEPSNEGKFINTGLWSWSRHPNYFGEIMLWFGIAIIAFPVLSGWQLLTLISPVFVALLLIRISGIPMLEARADEKWGGQPDYEGYKSSTSILIPKPPAKP
jgi:steroid 5-alpha reductase family enzyme